MLRKRESVGYFQNRRRRRRGATFIRAGPVRIIYKVALLIRAAETKDRKAI